MQLYSGVTSILLLFIIKGYMYTIMQYILVQHLYIIIIYY